MSGSRNRVEDSSNKKTKQGKKFFPLVAGNTKNCHEKIVRKLKKKGAKRGKIASCDVVIIFCPIVSRFESDIAAALSDPKLEEEEAKRSVKVILVAMHHTHSTEYVVPPKSQHSHKGQTISVVHCLFHETKGLLTCPLNKQAVTTLRQQMALKSHHCSIL